MHELEFLTFTYSYLINTSIGSSKVALPVLFVSLSLSYFFILFAEYLPINYFKHRVT